MVTPVHAPAPAVEIPPAVARLLAVGDRRDAAESLACLDGNEEITQGEVETALSEIAPHLPAEERATAYEDLKLWHVRRQVTDEMGAPWDEVNVDHEAEVDRCLTELTGVNR